MATTVIVNRQKSLMGDKSPLSISPTDKRSFLFEIADADLVSNDVNLATRLINIANGEDVSAASLTGSTTATGGDNLISTKALAGNLEAENDYMLIAEGTMDGELSSGRIILKCRSEGAV